MTTQLQTMHIIQATSAAHVRRAKHLFLAYAQSLDIDLTFQGFAAELAALPGDYVPPAGALLLAMCGHEAVGCVALRPLQLPLVAELKRLYVAPQGRGRGLGLSLTQAALAAARTAAYQRVRLDTLPSMAAAQHIYAQLGFRDIGAYRYNPVAGARYMELVL